MPDDKTDIADNHSSPSSSRVKAIYAPARGPEPKLAA